MTTAVDAEEMTPTSPAVVGRPGRVRWKVLSETWRITVALIAGLLLFLVNFAFSVDAGANEYSTFFGVILLADLAFGALALLLVPLRRRVPVTTGIILGLVGGFSTAALPAALIVLVSVATRRRWQEITAVGAAWLVGLGLVELFDLTLWPVPATTSETLLTSVLLVIVLAGASLSGMYIGNRRDLVMFLRERAFLAEADQHLRMAQAREHERTRIAREMHDAMGHRLSLIAMHAGALRYRTNLDPSETINAVEVVHDSSRQALEDLRHVLGVLRDPELPITEHPAPGAADVAELVATERHATLLMKVDATAIPSTMSRHAYRIVQECLTNARKHAPGSDVTITITRAGGNLRITVTNPMPRTASTGAEAGGYGLIGIDERAGSLGGTMSVQISDTEYRVDVLLPWLTA